MIARVNGPITDDRRIQKTKKYLAEALAQLIAEKGYEEVTIQDIIDKANVGRSTFYAHYESKEQLLLNNINFQKELIETDANDETLPYGVNLVYMFNHLHENLPIVRQICGRKIGQQLANHFTEIIATKIIEHHKRKLFLSKKESIAFRYKAQAAAAGVVRMLFTWLSDETPLACEEAIKLAENILKTPFEKK
jgi:AcrR family transcriptional regulator